MALNPKKDLKVYYSISEVAEMFNLTDTTLRFWEKEFPQISPRKGPRGVRQYTKKDIEIVRVINNLVRVRGLRIDAARTLLRKNHEGTVQHTEVVDRLIQLREELKKIKGELDVL